MMISLSEIILLMFGEMNTSDPNVYCHNIDIKEYIKKFNFNSIPQASVNHIPLSNHYQNGEMTLTITTKQSEIIYGILSFKIKMLYSVDSVLIFRASSDDCLLPKGVETFFSICGSSTCFLNTCCSGTQTDMQTLC